MLVPVSQAPGWRLGWLLGWMGLPFAAGCCSSRDWIRYKVHAPAGPVAERTEPSGGAVVRQEQV